MNADKKLIRCMIEQFKKYPEIVKVVLFGSRARGDNTERSDYDIAVFGEISPPIKMILRADFRELLPTLHKIDLVFMQDLKTADFINSIEREGVTIYDAENAK